MHVYVAKKWSICNVPIRPMHTPPYGIFIQAALPTFLGRINVYNDEIDIYMHTLINHIIQSEAISKKPSSGTQWSSCSLQNKSC